MSTRITKRIEASLLSELQAIVGTVANNLLRAGEIIAKLEAHNPKYATEITGDFFDAARKVYAGVLEPALYMKAKNLVYKSNLGRIPVATQKTLAEKPVLKVFNAKTGSVEERNIISMTPADINKVVNYDGEILTPAEQKKRSTPALRTERRLSISAFLTKAEFDMVQEVAKNKGMSIPDLMRLRLKEAGDITSRRGKRISP